MPTATEQTLTVHDLYTLRDNIGLSRKECRQPPRTRSLFEWGKAQQAYYLDDLMRNITSPPIVYVWEPVDGSGKGAVLDGRQRLKAIFSYLDGNYPLGETASEGWAGKTYSQLLATNPHLAETILRTPIQVVTVQASSYWEAAIAVYPQICGYHNEAAEHEQRILQSCLGNEDDIFTDKEYCDWRVSNLKMGIAHRKRTVQIEFRYAGLQVPVPQIPPHSVSMMIEECHLRATEFVARHHHRGVIPC